MPKKPHNPLAPIISAAKQNISSRGKGGKIPPQHKQSLGQIGNSRYYDATAFKDANGNYDASKLAFLRSINEGRGESTHLITSAGRDYEVGRSGKLRSVSVPKLKSNSAFRSDPKPAHVPAPLTKSSKSVSNKTSSGKKSTQKIAPKKSQLKGLDGKIKGLQEQARMYYDLTTSDVSPENKAKARAAYKDVIKRLNDTRRVRDAAKREQDALKSSNAKTEISERHEVAGNTASPSRSTAPRKSSAPATRGRKINPESARSKAKLKKMIPVREVDTAPTTHRAAITAARNQIFNKEARTRFNKLSTVEKLKLLKGQRGAGKILSGIRNRALDTANSRVESITFGHRGATTPEQKKIFGTLIKDEGKLRKDGVSRGNLRVIRNKSSIGPNKNETTKIDSKGRKVVVRVSSARVANREAGYPKEKARLARLAKKRKARQSRIAQNKKMYGFGYGGKQPPSNARRRYERIRQKQFRDQYRDDDAIARENKGIIDATKKIQKKLGSSRNNKTWKQLVKGTKVYVVDANGKRTVRSKPLNQGEFKRGLMLIENSLMSKSIKLTKKTNARIKRQRLPKGLYPAMRHSAKPGKRLKPSLITPEMKSQVSGKLNIARLTGISDPRFVGGPKRRLHSIYQTMSIPYRDFGDLGRGVMMTMGLKPRIKIDITRIMSSLRTGIPNTLKAGIVSASDEVGRKMLDIIEPYVPKDMGYMYMSAKTNIDQTSNSMVSLGQDKALGTSEMYGVSISYNTPYAEMVYFDETKRHGKEYNQHHGVQEKGQKETARWIEVAIEKETAQFRGILGIWAKHMKGALNAYSGNVGKQ